MANDGFTIESQESDVTVDIDVLYYGQICIEDSHNKHVTLSRAINRRFRVVAAAGAGGTL